MPTIVSSKGQSNIEAIKRYFCSEYACQMVAQAAGVDYERMIAGDYKLLIEPIAYFTHNGQYYCMTATEAALYDQKSGGALRKTMTSLTHKNLPLSMFLEFSDLGLPAWTGSTTSKQSNADIISSLGVGIVWFDERPPEGEIEAPDVEYRVDTDVITSVTLRTDTDLTPDNPASVTFHILGTTYRVNDIVIPADDSQVVWVKWHTPSTPQSVTITVSVSGAYTAQDTFVAEIVDLNEHIPPDPTATDTNPNYTVSSLPNEPQKLTANWGVWSCYWVPVWVWCDHDDWGHWVDEGYWEYEYTGYSASISGVMSLMPDDIVPTASGKSMKSGYGVKQDVTATLSTDAPTSHITHPQTAFSVFPEFQYETYLRLLQRVSSGRSAKFTFQPNEFSTYNRTVHFSPLWFPDSTDYTVFTQVWDTWTPDGMLGGYNLPVNVAHSLDDVEGLYVTADLAAGDYILTSKVSSVPVSSDVALNDIPSGKVAISLTVKTLASGLSDKLQPNDIVRIYHFLETAEEVPELRFVKVLSVTDSDGINVDNTKEPAEDEEPQQSATITVLASPEQARIITELENDGVAHVALISRNNDQLAEELLAEQDKTLQEIYFPETLVEENADAQSSEPAAEGDAENTEGGEPETVSPESGQEDSK